MSSIAETMGRFSYSRNGFGMVDEGCQVRITITSIATVENHVRYRVRVVNVTTKQAWEVAHRYSDFLKLRNDLIDYFKKAESKCPGCLNYEKVIKLFEFPRKHLFTSRSKVVLNYRKKALRAFIALLSSHTFTPAPKCPCCSGFAFTAVVDFLTYDPLNAHDPMNAPVNVERPTERMSIDMIRQSIDVKDFISYIPITGEQIVDSNGIFTKEVKNEKLEQIRKEIKERARESGITKMDGAHTSPTSSASTTSFGSTCLDRSSPRASMECILSDVGSPAPAPVAKRLTTQKSGNSKRQKRRRKKNTQQNLRSDLPCKTESLPTLFSIADQDETLDLTFAKKLNVALE